MAYLALRNPQYKWITIPSSGVLSTTCTITINGTLAYTLNKNVTASTTIHFEIAELSRDFLSIAYDGSYNAQSIDIVVSLQNYSGSNGTGSAVGSPSNSTDKGIEAYGTFTEAVSPQLPFSNRQLPTWLIAGEPTGITDIFEIFIPENTSGYINHMNAAETIIRSNYSATDTQITGSGLPTLNITRIPCTKYGTGTRVVFLNKFGVQQDLFFFLKDVKNLSRTSTSYNSNTLVSPYDERPYYSQQDAATKVFNTQAKQTHSLSSGFYPEFAVEYFEQLLLSEYVWMVIPAREHTGSDFIPVTVKSSKMVIKKSVNDRLIEYTIEFEDAFNYINNIR